MFYRLHEIHDVTIQFAALPECFPSEAPNEDNLKIKKKKKTSNAV